MPDILSWLNLFAKVINRPHQWKKSLSRRDFQKGELSKIITGFTIIVTICLDTSADIACDWENDLLLWTHISLYLQRLKKSLMSLWRRAQQ